jgi:4'-phosphopantetheinyl transferase
MMQCAGAPVEIHWFDLRDPELLEPAELSSDEARRSSALSTDVLRRRYIASHVALRRLLSKRLGIAEPRGLALSFHRGLKPRPVPVLPSISLTFSLSRSAEVAVVALGDGIEVGVDVETDHPAFRSTDLQGAISTPFERSVLAELTAQDRAAAAQRLWVRKEAIVKALGTGFAEPPSSVSAGNPRDASGVQRCGSRTVRWIDLPIPQEGAAAAAAWCEPELSI